MRSLSVATSDELNEGSFLGTGGFDESVKDGCVYPAAGLTASRVRISKDAGKIGLVVLNAVSLKNAGDKASPARRAPNQRASRYSLSSVCQFAGTAPAGPGVG